MIEEATDTSSEFYLQGVKEQTMKHETAKHGVRPWTSKKHPKQDINRSLTKTHTHRKLKRSVHQGETDDR